MSLFSNPIKPSKYVKEGIVLEVDAKRNFCKVRTFTGQVMQAVTWLEVSGGSSRSGSSKTPRIGDRVMISTHCGYPLILGFLPVAYAYEVGTPNRIIERPEWIEGTDTGNLSFFDDNDMHTNESAPGDRLVGDHIFSTDGGSMMGVLRGGSFFAKASALAQVFVSKIDDMVRIVSRNHEVYSDSHTEVHANIRGRNYNFKGVGATLKDNREDRYQYYEVIGDTVAGEALKGNYHNRGPNAAGAADNVIKKQVVADFPNPSDNGYNESYDNVYEFTLELNGHMKRVIRRPDGVEECIIDNGTAYQYHSVKNNAADSLRDQDPDKIQDRVNGTSAFADFLMDNNQINQNYNGISIIRQTGDAVTIEYNGQDTITLDGSSITLDRNGTTVVLQDGFASMSSSGHSIVVNSSGISMS